MSSNVPESKSLDQVVSTATNVPKRITNAQTVCNEKNEKGKLCNGHLKQLRTAGEPAEIHLRGDDVLFQCQVDGTLYMGPPLGHVRDPYKQSRYVEAELSALLQAAGGTLPVVKKDERGVFVIVEGGGEHSHAKPAASKPPAPKPEAPATSVPQQAAAESPAAKPTTRPTVAPAPAAKPVEPKAGGQPNRQLFKRSTYAGVTDTGPVAGETFEQKVARLKALSAAAKQREEEGGGGHSQKTVEASPAPAVETQASSMATAPAVETQASSPAPAAPVQTPVATPTPAAETHKATGKADRTLMKRSTYCGVVDTGPVPGETFEQKVARLTALSAAAKQRADEGGT